MATANGCNLPDDLSYHVSKHIWVRAEGRDEVTLGLTDVAQHLSGKVIAVTLKKVGKVLAKGQSTATVESSKWVGPVPTPVSGEVIAVNSGLSASPELINSDCYGAGWVVRLRATSWESESAELASGPAGIEAYQSFLDEEGIRCG